jgi:hypothetical protein
VKNRLAVGVCLLWTIGAESLAAADKTTIREFITEPATLVSLGFEWRIDGDDNRNAIVSVAYRKKGEQTWKEGLPLLRIGNERINENSLQYVTPNGFAGSIFDLEPATDYECRSVMADPDGIDGRTTQIASVLAFTTRVHLTRTTSIPIRLACNRGTRFSFTPVYIRMTAIGMAGVLEPFRAAPTF